MKTKKYLASANSTDGFLNKFKYINIEKNGFTYILKGGPGTGKSTFMKNVGKFFENENYFVEYFYCSSDSSSLDGVRIKNISIVDGTAPHVTEATIPGIKEKIVNVGEFIGNEVKEHSGQIKKFLALKQNFFKKAYLYFDGLGKIFEIENSTLKHDKNLGRFNTILGKIQKSKNLNFKRELFSSFISKEGYKSFYKDNSYLETIVLSGNFIENENLFNKILSYLDEEKISHIKFSSIFLPKLAEAIYIEKGDILIVAENAFYENFINFKNKNLIEKIVKKIARNLYMAKINHKKVEEFYIKSMNFDGLNKLQNTVIEEIKNQIK